MEIEVEKMKNKATPLKLVFVVTVAINRPTNRKSSIRKALSLGQLGNLYHLLFRDFFSHNMYEI
jgi:hypothetical protein